MTQPVSFVVRTLLTVALVALVLVAGAPPALAHGRGSDATNFSSTITDVPGIEGLSWRVLGGDEYLWVDNNTGSEVLIPGYEGEPYLRIGPDGVLRNRNSAATYLNTDRLARVTPPPGVGPDVEPDWERVSDDSSWFWHDHRIHFMGVGTPAQVPDPSVETEVFPWSVPFSIQDEDYEVEGTLRWVPGPPAWPWLLGGLVLSLPALAGLRARREDLRSLARPAAAVLGAATVLNLIHLVDDLSVMPSSVWTIALAAVQTALFIGVAGFGAVRAWQGGNGAFTALGVGAGALLVGQGILYLPVLTASQIASVFPDPLGRLAVGWSIAQALTVGAIAVVGTRRLLPEAPDESATAEVPRGAGLPEGSG